jgi:hypothetical protein
MEDSILETRLAEVLAATKQEFEATMVSSRVAVAVNIGKGDHAVGYITLPSLEQIMANGKLLDINTFTHKYNKQLQQKVLENYGKLVDFVLANVTVSSRGRRARLFPTESA